MLTRFIKLRPTSVWKRAQRATSELLVPEVLSPSSNADPPTKFEPAATGSLREPWRSSHGKD